MRTPTLLAALAVALAAGCARRAAPVCLTPGAEVALNMPAECGGEIPALLSQTGAFADTRALRPAAHLIPYEVNVPFWSDGGGKTRWLALPPGGRVRFSATEEWSFPAGTVFLKHFELAGAGQSRRMETRL